jgi:sec-independent protein translocase protein TatA
LAAFLVLLLILLLLYGGDRLAIVGKGLGEGVKAFRKSVRHPEPPEPPPRTISVEVSPPKLLPAKGETSSGGPSDDHERH